MESPACRAEFVRQQIPKKGLFTGHSWRIATKPFTISKSLAKELEFLGRVLLQFYRSSNLLYNLSLTGKQPAWVSECLDKGKPNDIIQLQRHKHFKQEIPSIIRPDIILTENGYTITELDSVPGGIGLTAWLNSTYSDAGFEVIGGPSGMKDGFSGIFNKSGNVRIIVSDESETYRPEMEWLCSSLDSRFSTHDAKSDVWRKGDSVYRFFELFDLTNVDCASNIFSAAVKGEINITPPPKSFLEEKMLFALLWNRNLQDFWQGQLGGSFFQLIKNRTPQSWLITTESIPPHAAIPGLDLSNWKQLCELSQKERNLVLKVSGFSELAWGSRGLHIGNDLSQANWANAVNTALEDYENSPRILQRYHKPMRINQEWFDFDSNDVKTMNGRVRLCPYYFLNNKENSTQAELQGVLATICPSNKKIIHGMSEAIMAPCTISDE